MNPEHPIGIFDSGIGGLSIANSINRTMPNESIVYFGDTQHLPYGNKSVKKINYYCSQIVEFLINQQCKAIVIACNTASSVALNNIIKIIKKKCLLFNVIDPVIKFIQTQKNIKNIGLIGTNATINSTIYEQKISILRSDIKINSLATPLLANLIEENNPELHTMGILESYLKNSKLHNIDSLILGCTHYPIISKQIASFYKGKIKTIDATQFIGNVIQKELKKNNLINFGKPKHTFYVSDYTENFQQKTKLFFPGAIILQEQNIFS